MFYQFVGRPLPLVYNGGAMQRSFVLRLRQSYDV